MLFPRLTGLLAFGLAAASAFAQPSPSPAPAPAAAAAPGAAPAPAAKTYSQQDLDQLLAPIALYPDSLLAQVLMASTYPLDVVEAARWSKANPTVKDKALEDAMQQQRWDPSVKALTSVPQVLQQMNDKLDWTQRLGDAFLAQQTDVMNTVQSLRAKAQAAGNLQSTSQQQVKTDTSSGKTVYVIESPKPDVIYVPTYNPYTIYGPWWYPAPPFYMYPPAYVYPPGLAFTTGVFVGAAIWGGCNWGSSRVDINVNHYNQFNRTTITQNNWEHNAANRRGVAYGDSNVASRYDKGADQRAAQREQFRGRADDAGAGLKGGQGDLAGAAKSSGAAKSAAGDAGSRDFGSAAGNRDGGRAAGSRDAGGGSSGRDFSSRDFANSSGRGGGFSGVGSGDAMRGASARGGSSRGSMGGGGGGRRR